MESLHFLSIEEIVIIHEKMIDIGGGSAGIRDIELLHSAIERPKAMFGGKYLYPSLFKMAAALLQSLIKNHPFLDGNKRTAFFCTLRFLEINGFALKLTNEEIVVFCINIDTKNLKIEEIAKWLKQRKVQIRYN